MKTRKNGFDSKPCQLPFQLNWLTGKMVGKVLKKIGILLNDLERNSSGGNEKKQDKMLSLLWPYSGYPSGRGQSGERKRLKNVRALAAADIIFLSE